MTLTREWDLPNEPASVREARRVVCDAAAPATSGDTVEVLALLVSELVTNAFRHGDGPAVHVSLDMNDGIRVEVRDEGEGFALATRAPRDAPGGYGLQLVGMLAQDWGAESNSHTRVWFRLPR